MLVDVNGILDINGNYVLRSVRHSFDLVEFGRQISVNALTKGVVLTWR